MNRIETSSIEGVSAEEIRRQRNELMEKWKALSECSAIFEEGMGLFMEMDRISKKIGELDIRLGKAA